MIYPGERARCETCGQVVTMTRGGLRRHKGKTEFDLATDGVCSGSHSTPPDENREDES